MSVFKQLLKEFWIPLTAALGWTIYNFAGQRGSEWSVRGVVNIFGPSFFLASWLIGQIFRVRKQQKVEGGLAGIEASVKRTLAELEAKTVDLTAHIIGGESVCYMHGHAGSAGACGPLVAVHIGRHPLYEVNARIVDLDILEQIKGAPTIEDIRKAETHLQIGNLVPGHALLLPMTLVLEPSTARRFNIFYTARNGSFVQLLRLRTVDGIWLSALKVMRGNAVVFERVEEKFPRTTNGSVEWERA